MNTNYLTTTKMKKSLLFTFAILFCYTMNAQDPIFIPGMSIASYGVVDSPIGEEVDKIIDGDINTKFLDFELDDGMGFTVDLGGVGRTASSIEITTANDFEERDPTQFEVLGSNDGTTFTSIAIGSIPCVSDRFFSRTFEFANDVLYTHYRVNYTNACDPTGGIGIPSIQIAETQLFEIVLGTEDNQASADLKVYPNPSNGLINVRYTGIDLLTQAVLIDLNGRIVQNVNVNTLNGSGQIQLNNLASGMYIIQITTDSSLLHKRIIVH